ncbi:MAG: hypothetical protein ACFB20_00795 [Opitutales bacterium]
MIEAFFWLILSASIIAPGGFGLFLLAQPRSSLAFHYMNFCQRRTYTPLKDEHFIGKLGRVIAMLKTAGLVLVAASITIFFLVLNAG